MHSIKPRFILVSIATLCVVVIAAAPSYHFRRTKVRCCVPNRDYQNKIFSPSLRSLSSPAVTLPEPAATDQQPANASNADPCDPRQRGVTKVFQFTKNPRLAIDHCSISEMAVLLHENGGWSVNLRANQNPRQERREGLDVTTAEEQQRFTDHLIRNQFYVRIYCYAAYGAPAQEVLVGRPVVIPLDLKPFWVQRRVPYLHFATGCEPRIRRAFDLIDRVEIEFSYRYDPSQARGT